MKVWSQVRLKSGGFEMTATSIITEANGEISCICKWKDESGELNMFTFKESELDFLSEASQ